jgi:hypothetical protein
MKFVNVLGVSGFFFFWLLLSALDKSLFVIFFFCWVFFKSQSFCCAG